MLTEFRMVMAIADRFEVNVRKKKKEYTKKRYGIVTIRICFDLSFGGVAW